MLRNVVYKADSRFMKATVSDPSEYMHAPNFNAVGKRLKDIINVACKRPSNLRYATLISQGMYA